MAVRYKGQFKRSKAPKRKKQKPKRWVPSAVMIMHACKG